MGGPNGPDTCFLVRAGSLDQAAALVDRQLKALPSPLVSSWCGAIHLLGEESSTDTEARILRGPYVQNAYRYGWRHWYREEPDDPWVERTDR